MELKEISPFKRNTTLCYGGRYVYHNYKDKKPYGYRLRCMTNDPFVELQVVLPPDNSDKFKKLKKCCLASAHGIAEVSFINLDIKPFSYINKKTGELIISYRATATDFTILED